jgi:hypothetical protein
MGSTCLREDVTYRLTFTQRSVPALFRETDRFLGFTPRSIYVNGVREDEGLTLSGAGAHPAPDDRTVITNSW